MTQCPECFRQDVHTRWRADEFEWHAQQVPHRPERIRAIIPVRECLFCGFEWTDSEADEARGRALQRHLAKQEPRF